MKKLRYRIIPGDGDPCPKCAGQTQILEHIEITARHRSQPFYYERWFYCLNTGCSTRSIMPKRYRVFRDKMTQAHYTKPKFGRASTLTLAELEAAIRRDVVEIAMDEFFNTPETIQAEIDKRLVGIEQTRRIVGGIDPKNLEG